MYPFLILWAALAIATLALALYRKIVSLREENYIHLAEGEESHIPEQVAMTRRMDAIDRWGKALTVVTALFGLLLAAAFLYLQWQRS